MIRSEASYSPSWISAVGALTGLAKSLGIQTDDTAVASISGFAFRLAVADQVLPVSNTSYSWFDVFQSAFDRLGIVASIWKSSQGQLCHDQYCRNAFTQCTKALESGKPSVIWESFEFGLMTGVDQNSNDWECDGVAGKTIRKTPEFGNGEVPAMFAAIPAVKVEVDQMEQTLMSLRVAVAIGFTSKPPYPSDFHIVTGVEGYKKWIEQLDKDFNIYGNSLLAQITIESRRHAALYLARISKLFSGVPQNLLLRASERFAQVNAKLSRLAKCFPFPGSKENVNPENIEESKQALHDCYVMENEGLQLIATAIENIDAKS
jgi:hypothetical protein